MNLQDIISLDFAYLDTFSKRKDTKWGSLFYNESQPSYYDANHAHISDLSVNPSLIMEEVVKFYNSKNIIPRFYLYNLDLQQELISILIANSFGYEELMGPVQLWDKKLLEKERDEHLLIERVSKHNYSEALHIECSIKEFGGKEVREKAFEVEFNHPSFEHYLLRFNGTACATACIFICDNQARMESVATLEEFRGRGLIGELIHFIQTEVAKKGYENLWVFPINERVEKVYQKFGFKTVSKLKMGHAYLGGRSIKEIQE
ncbi:GNAT family N-acetyltransferase [Psychrobacillus sp. FJAT-51614]|uniref:GNAT family N-acetyltransferase n=1 Tax=Psychrobacillus mangrovi TaxID=3117745 RepID=A0ABU8F731_9BACI